MSAYPEAPKSRGMVTFELAVGILSAALLTALLSWGVGLIALQAQCSDVASQVARQLARGDVEAAEQAEQRVPTNGRVSVMERPTEIEVAVVVQVSWGRLGPIDVTGSAVAPTQGR